MTLENFFAENKKLAVAFSGGTDSAYLLYRATKAGCDVTAYYVKSAFQPEFEYEDAKNFCRAHDIPIRIIQTDVLSDTELAANPADRCYICKKKIFGAIRAQASADGHSILADGSNASDKPEERPGMRALTELSVVSPLRLCGITKSEVRTLSKDAGLSTWNKPPYSCLATRIPAGEKLTQELLTKIEKAEDALFAMGFKNFRVRYFHTAARLQFASDEIERAFSLRKKIETAFKPYFEIVLYDGEER